MTASIIDGKAVSKLLRKEITEGVERIKAEKGITPGLAVVLVGEDPASQTYVRNKEKSCIKVGMYSEVHRLPAETSEEELLKLVDQLNRDPKLHGILVQLPLPKHIDETKVIEAIDPAGCGRLPSRQCRTPAHRPGQLPALHSFWHHGTPQTGKCRTQGKHAVVVGRSNIVGKPSPCSCSGACHRLHLPFPHRRPWRHDPPGRRAGSGSGQSNFITGDMIKPGAVVIDCGHQPGGGRPGGGCGL